MEDTLFPPSIQVPPPTVKSQHAPQSQIQCDLGCLLFLLSTELRSSWFQGTALLPWTAKPSTERHLGVLGVGERAEQPEGTSGPFKLRPSQAPKTSRGGAPPGLRPPAATSSASHHPPPCHPPRSLQVSSTAVFPGFTSFLLPSQVTGNPCSVALKISTPFCTPHMPLPAEDCGLF